MHGVAHSWFRFTLPQARLPKLLRIRRTRRLNINTDLSQRHSKHSRSSPFFGAQNPENCQFHNTLTVRDLPRGFMGSTTPPSLRFGGPWHKAGRDVGLAKSGRARSFGCGPRRETSTSSVESLSRTTSASQSNAPPYRAHRDQALTYARAG